MEKFRTLVLERNEILNVLKAIQPFIQLSWGDTVQLSHGAVTDVDIEKQYICWNISTNELLPSILEQEKLEPYVVGKCDLFISNLNGTEDIHICHEADIHFDVQFDLAKEIKNTLQKFKIGLELRQ